uniref:Secreted protein n=1 Tax=Mesocestoides corti TaxID=53468 RepID=A0A5K3EJL9_MESCO
MFLILSFTCCESRLFTPAPPFHSLSPAVRILNSRLISTNIYPGLSLHLGLDVGACRTHASEV